MHGNNGLDGEHGWSFTGAQTAGGSRGSVTVSCERLPNDWGAEAGTYKPPLIPFSIIVFICVPSYHSFLTGQLLEQIPNS